jgi:hypothetical protein
VFFIRVLDFKYISQVRANQRNQSQNGKHKKIQTIHWLGKGLEALENFQTMCTGS